MTNFWPEQWKDGIVMKCVGEGLGRSRFWGEKDLEFGFGCINIYCSFKNLLYVIIYK